MMYTEPKRDRSHASEALHLTDDDPYDAKPLPVNIAPYSAVDSDVKKLERFRCQSVTLIVLLVILLSIAITSAASNWARVKCDPEEDKFYFKKYENKDGKTKTYDDDLENFESGGWQDHVCYKMIDDFKSAGDGALATYWTVWVSTIICGVLFTTNMIQNGEKRLIRSFTTLSFFVSILFFFLPVTTWLSAIPSTSTVTDCYHQRGCVGGGTFYKLEAGGASCYVGCAICLIAGIVSYSDNKKTRAYHENHV